LARERPEAEGKKAAIRVYADDHEEEQDQDHEEAEEKESRSRLATSKKLPTLQNMLSMMKDADHAARAKGGTAEFERIMAQASDPVENEKEQVNIEKAPSESRASNARLLRGSSGPRPLPVQGVRQPLHWRNLLGPMHWFTDNKAGAWLQNPFLLQL